MIRLRSASQNAILLNFDTAREHDVEGRLWEAHLKVNTRFRKKLSRVSTLGDGIYLDHLADCGQYG